MKVTTLPVAFAILIGLSGCESPIEMKLNSLAYHNKTIINLPLDSSRMVIKSLFNDYDHQIDNAVLKPVFIFRFPDNQEANSFHQVFFSAEAADSAVFGQEYFRSHSASNIYLTSMGGTWDSQTYYAAGEQLPYVCEFALIFKKVDSQRTQIVVTTINPLVYHGYAGISAHGLVAKEFRVSPSPLEESTIVRFISSELRNKLEVVPVAKGNR